MRKMIHAFALGLALIAAAAAAEAKTGKKAAKPAVEAETFAEETMDTAKLVVDPSNQSPKTVSAETLPGESIETAAAPAEAPAMPKAELNKLPENQIPVLAQAKETKKSDSTGLARLMATLGVLVVVLGAASFGLKRWMSKSKGNNANTRIKVLTQHHLGPKKSLAIIQVAGESLLIGVTDQNISMLKTLSLLDDEIPEAVPGNFNRALNEFDEDDEAVAQAETQATEEDFTISGLAEIRDTVSTRSKNLRRY